MARKPKRRFHIHQSIAILYLPFNSPLLSHFSCWQVLNHHAPSFATPIVHILSNNTNNNTRYHRFALVSENTS